MSVKSYKKNYLFVYSLLTFYFKYVSRHLCRSTVILVFTSKQFSNERLIYIYFNVKLLSI